MKKLIVILALLTAPAFATLTDQSNGRSVTVANGVTTVYVFNFPVVNRADLQVTITLGGLNQVIAYTVVLNSDQISAPGGTVTFVAAPPNTATVQLQRKEPLTQTTVLNPYSPFPAKTIEKTHDAAVRKIQQVERDVLDLAAKEAADIATTIAGSVGGSPNLLQVTATGSTSPMTLADWFSQIANVKTFGATCDGSHDDAPAIRAAIATGKTVYIPYCASPYLLNSYDLAGWNGDAVMFYPQEGQTIYAERGAQLKAANGILNSGVQPNGGVIFLSDTKSHVTLRNIRVDMNGANNMTPGTGFHPAYAFNFEGGSYNTIEGCEIINSPGRNAIANFGYTRGHMSDHMTIRNNYIRNGGTTLAGNSANQNDWSAIYVESLYALVEGNQIQHDLYPTAAVLQNGGIEIHGSYSVYSNNWIEKAYPCFYVATRDTADVTISDVKVTDNFCDGAQGVSFFPNSLVDTYSRLEFSRNTFYIYRFAGSLVNAWGFSMSRQDNATYTKLPGYLTDSSITNNTFFDPNQPTVNEQSIGVRLSATKNVKIQGNLFKNMGSSCFVMAENPQGAINVSFIGNQCIDSNQASAVVNPSAVFISARDGTLVAWAGATTYAKNHWIKPTVNNNFTYEATQAGSTCVSGGGEPTWPLVLGNTVADGTCTWTTRAPWGMSGIVTRDNIFAETVNQASFAGYGTNFDFGANSSAPATNMRIGPNVLVNMGVVGNGSGWTSAGPYVVPASAGTITLAAGTGTATVTLGSRCTCSDTTTATNVCKPVVSSTTLTITGTGTDVIAYTCN